MKKIDWDKVLENIMYLSAMGMGFGILYFGFQILWQFITTIETPMI